MSTRAGGEGQNLPRLQVRLDLGSCEPRLPQLLAGVEFEVVVRVRVRYRTR